MASFETINQERRSGRSSRSIAVVVAVLVASSVSGSPWPDQATAAWSVTDVDVATVAPGLNLQVLQRRGTGSFAPRAVVDTPAGMFILDFGGWSKNRGSLVKTARTPGATRTILQRKLDRPHGMQIGPNESLLIGEVGAIQTVALANPAAKRRFVSLPARPGAWKHPLTQFVIASDGSLLVNHGSVSDNCEGSKSATCAEAEGPKGAGVILRYSVKNGLVSASPSLHARGLRNSMAMVVHPTGTVIAAENSRDAIEDADPSLNGDELPHDELNVIVAGSNYGWPYCFDAQRNAPEFRKYACKSTVAPTVLLPAHSAPLGMTYWKRPADSNPILVVALHGYRATGQRLIGFATNERGVPVGDSIELVRWKGEADSADEVPGPVGLSVARDNALLIADDRRGMILELTAK